VRILGVLVVTKFGKIQTAVSWGLTTLTLLAVAGCGGSSKTNVVSVSVSPSTTVIVSQSITLAAVVTGSTNTDISSWACTYFTTTVDSTGKSTDGADQPCTAETGTIPANVTTTTVTYTAPSKVPDPTKIAGTNCAASTTTTCLFTIRITATAAADTKKTGFAKLSLDSGIAVGINPTTATVPTGEQQPFSAALSNDLQSQGVTWLITQATAVNNNFPSLASCSPGCGSISSTTNNTATYTAPATAPTTATVTLVATSKADTTRFALGTITIIQGGPITFNGISPTIAPQGASLYSIYLDAPFISSASTITLTPSNTSHQPIVLNSSSNQFKILFPIPTSAVPNPSSTGARISLVASNLANADTYTVSVKDPAQPVTNGSGPFTFQVLPVRPTSVASIPDSIAQNSRGNELNLAIDGGYFGPGSGSGSNTGSLANAFFNGNALGQNPDVASSSRQLNLSFPTSAVNSAPGLYPLSVARTVDPKPSPDNPSVTNLAVYPDYSVTPPQLFSTIVQSAGIAPSAMDIDTKLGILAVAETGSNLVQFFSIGNGSLTALPCPASSCAVAMPTGLSINQTNHTVAVASPQDQSVVVLPLPGSSGAAGVTYPLTISLAGLLPSNFTPTPLPYSVGVDSDTNMALVAFSSSATPTTAKVGFLLDLNKDTQTCLANGVQTTPPCVFAQVTLNTGTYPQIAMVPHQHLAYVTPGGTGVINGIDVTKSSSQLQITNIALISGLVTVTVNVPSGQTLGLNPGNPGSVLIQGVPLGSSNNTNFNGVFSVQSVLNANSFTYALNSSVNDNATGDSDSMVFFSSPNVVVSISQTAQGIAFNPITRMLAIADANATGNNGPQINLLRSADLQISSITLRADCTSATTSCSGAPELLGTSSVAFQPYSNLLVSYNPQQNQVSISNPVTLQRTAFVCNLLSGSTACLTNPTNNTELGTFQGQIKLPGTGTSQVTVTAGGHSTTLNLFGGLAVDPATNQAFVAQSGSNQILIVNLGPTPSTTLKPAQITELQVPTVPGAIIGGIPGALMPQGTLTSNADLTNVQIFGGGFGTAGNSTTQVRLDAVSINGTCGSGPCVTVVSDRQINATIPASFLASPHRYSVDIVNGSVGSNSTDFFVIKAVDLKTVCSGGKPQPSSVAIADQLPGQGFSPIAVVTNRGCGNVAVIDINPANTATFGSVKSTIATGNAPLGVAVSPRFGLAVVANNTDGTASVLDLRTGTQKVAAVTVGAQPTGVAISEDTGAALIANTGANTVSEINLALLFGSSPATSLSATTIGVDTSPIAVAIDPDRGSNNRGLAVITALQLISGSTSVGVLDAVDIGGATPAKATIGAVGGSVTATPTGIVFDPTVSPRVFYATSSGGNVVTSFNPDSGATSSVHVGINPSSLAINPQTGGIMTINFTSQTVSIIDTISNPFTTRRSYGLGGSAQFGIAIDQFTNMAVLADQANNRVLIFPLPN
jgi:DNA-binding beta-propeller fold protein YncE